jgi:hypothetical protein
VFISPDKSSVLSVQVGNIQDFAEIRTGWWYASFSPRHPYNSDAKCGVLSTAPMLSTVLHTIVRSASPFSRVRTKSMSFLRENYYSSNVLQNFKNTRLLSEYSCVLINFHAKTTRFPPVFFCIILGALFKDSKIFFKNIKG